MLTKDDLGSCISGGVEKFIKAAQMCADDPDVISLSADFNKAYNNVLRTDTWAAIQEIGFQPLTQWFIFAYGDCPSVTYVFDFNVPLANGKSRKVRLPIGFPQGDNLSGFLFSITIRYIFRKLVAKYAALSVQFGFSTILDDTLLSLHKTHWAHLGDLVDDFVRTFASRNLKIQTSKTDLYCRTVSPALQLHAASISCGIKLHDKGLVACRIPVSHSPQFIVEYIDANYMPRISAAYGTMLEIWSALEFLPNERYNTFYIFVRLCFSSKFTYWLRNLLPQHAEPVALKIDECIDQLMNLLYPSMPGPAPTSALHRTLMSCSRMIETLPLSKNGAGVIRTRDIIPICHFSVVAESFSYVCRLATLVGITADTPDPSDSAYLSLFPHINDSLLRLQRMNLTSLAPDVFTLAINKECRFVQTTISTAFFNTRHDSIATMLPSPDLQAWFISRDNAFTSLPFNSSVRHVTHRRPPADNVFRFALALRTLRPIFEGYRCSCSVMSDSCGLHMLRCGMANPSPFTAIHHAVRDSTVRCMQDYIRRNAGSNFRVISERDDFHKCEVRRYHAVSNGSLTGLRCDAIMYEFDRPDQPWFIDYVQAQVNNPAAARVGKEVDNAHQKKITELTNAHPSVPASKVIPFAFSASGYIHPATLLFIDRFICMAASTPLSAAPSGEKLKFWHAVVGATVEKTAYLMSAHFQRFVNNYHTALFPHHMHQLQLDYAIPGRQRRRSRVLRRIPAASAAASDTSASLDTVPSQSSAPALPLLPLVSIGSTVESSSRPPQAHVPQALRGAVAREGLRPRVFRDYMSLSQNGVA